ncbi:MAG: SRPBCC domain-containing protein [Gammaproteobacteria bacterium]|nr:SRPBCC domain-containing protein [Gammaproteobacteria bacterium]
MNTNYTREIVVSSTPGEAYKALTIGFNRWWTTDCNSVTDAGDEITFKFGPSYWVMCATKLVPGKIVELKCIDAHHVHDGLPSTILVEWKGSKLKWNIQNRKQETKIAFIHEGLSPSLECYEVCEQGWDYFFAKSLKQYLDTGKGFPFENRA